MNLQPSTRHHCAAEGASLNSSSSPSFAVTADVAVEPCPAPQSTNGDAFQSLTPFMSSSASSATADTQAHDPVARPGSVLPRPDAVGGPVRSPTIRPPPNMVLSGHLHHRHSHLIHRSSASVAAPAETGSGRLQGLAAASSASAQTSSMAIRHSSTPPPYALVMDSLVRRYRAEEDRLSQWRQGGGGVCASAAFRRDDVQSRRQPRGAVEGEELTRAGLRGTTGRVLSGHTSSAADSGLRGVLTSAVQRTALVRAAQAWWRSRRELQRMSSKVSKRIHPATLSASPSAVAGAEAQHPSYAMPAAMPSAPAAPPAAPPFSSLSWLDAAGRSILGRLSHSLSLSSDRGKSVRLELLRPADAAQPRGARRDHRDDTVDDSVMEGQQAPGAEMAEMTAEAVPAGVATPVLSLSRMGSEALLAHPCESARQQAGAGGRGGALHRRQVDGEEGDLDTSIASSTCSSRGSRVSGGGRVTLQSTEAAGDSIPRQEAGRTGRHENSGSFTFSRVGGLRMHLLGGAATALSDAPEDSFRSAPRLLAQSRVRVARWLRRRQHLVAAKRSLRGVGVWPKPTTAADAEHFDASSCARHSAAASPPFSTASELYRSAADAAPSPWESALPPTWADRSGGDHMLRDGEVTEGATAASKRTTRAHVLEQLRAAIAAGMAACSAEQGGLVARQTTSEVQSSSGEPPVLSLAAQRTREHADDLARLTESLVMLTEFDGGAADGSGSGIRAHRASNPEDVKRASPMTLDQEQNVAAVPSHPSVGKATNAALPAWSPSCVHVSSIISAGQHRRSYHGNAQDVRGAETRTRDGRSCVHEVAAETAVDAFRSLLTDTTHTPHDVAVRAVYEAIMSEVCVPLVQRDVQHAMDVNSSAADRALTQWIERQLMVELTQPRPTKAQATALNDGSAASSAATLQPLVCTGVMRHIRSGVPVSLEHLRLDDADRQVLESVYARGASNAIAVKFDTGGYEISYRQLASLGPRSWLNDQVINNYLQLLCVEAEGAATASLPAARCRHRIASLGTHFYTKVESELSQSVDGFRSPPPRLPQLDSSSAVFRWLRHRKHLLEPYSPSDPRSVRAVLVPVNIGTQHWALAVLDCADDRWVMYDSMSRSDRARQRGAVILAHLSHVWRECKRHFGLVNTECTPAAAASVVAQDSPSSAAPQPSPWTSACVVAVPYVPFTDTLVTEGSSTAISPLDSLQPYDSLDELHRAAKRIRHQEALFVEQTSQKVLQGGSDAGGVGAALAVRAAPTPPPPPLSLTAATALPAEQLSDTEVEWFTGGFDHIPQQANGNDCGVFVCQVAWCVAQGVAVSFTQSDVSRLREVILLELLSKRLLRRYPTANTSSSSGV
ncbi:putative cysteine peptidase, Clan CA,family C48 [Leishmania major strain Friedlin]|uniref:Putative cysteine peptidase, Clan CA,family C48 n=1 Tax=Leishmania major TaxID=5664 RepID=Q4Q8Y5_LEIMA|nr:putative cysteine peptidase, Clan CA,family C48 [Leishmania major strain Friedlin]CAG9576532.1 SUMO1/Ulp2_-_putative [Leishmania major strain Friedlin]CAJ05515.1 putative cysteine peptidase, Clan CA,family C48 [Leishmania major strain Friedlin]|eukprot:XP_001684213.1 putative cysteine peptidase, Clan CA,family C48 [Leishmania major strain Friedlin]